MVRPEKLAKAAKLSVDDARKRFAPLAPRPLRQRLTIEQQISPDGTMLLDGEVTLAELEEDHGLAIDHPEVSTVAGLFLAEDGVLPSTGRRVKFKNYSFVAEEVRGMKILRVRLERLPAEG